MKFDPTKPGPQPFGVVAMPFGGITGVGQPLPQGLRMRFESLFGTDLSQVRVHSGPHAQEMGALAFAQGNDVHFAPGQYQPNTAEGQALLGHEIAHVVQQSALNVPPGGVAVAKPAKP